jgi:hypothetical protein
MIQHNIDENHTMKKKITTGLIFLLFLLITIIPVQSEKTVSIDRHRNHSNILDSVYPSTPDWISGSPTYSTGAALTDLNNDGWLDLIVSDGNDMSPGHVRVYLNDGQGHLPTTASWQSTDITYNGHLDVADINGDGWTDVAVSYLGNGYTTAPIARVYMNTNGVLSSTAAWSSNIVGEGFGLDFGDMNNDGRPDLALATGNPYSALAYHTYVYLNTNGSYGSSPSWQSSDQHINLGVLWVDADDDGWLDLAGIGGGHQTEIYRNLGGVLETTASWYTTDDANPFAIMLTAGDVTGDGIRDLFATDNTQLGGGDGWFKQYTGLPSGFYETTHSWGFYGGYGAAVALTDVNGDNTLDLATGTWWGNTNLFLNQGSGLPTTPSWTSSDATVNEKIVFGNVGPAVCEHTFTQQFTPIGNRRLFYLPHRQIQGVDTVTCDDLPLSPAEYTFSRDEGWIVVGKTPVQSLDVTYRYSPSQDMVVTNWDPDIGNYLYYNRLINFTDPDLTCNGTLSWDEIKPGTTIQGNFTVSNSGAPLSYLNWEVTSYPTWGTWSFTPASGTNLLSGENVTVHVDVIAPKEKHTPFQGNITIVNTENPNDYCMLHVTLTTPYTAQLPSRLHQRVSHFFELLLEFWNTHFLSHQYRKL